MNEDKKNPYGLKEPKVMKAMRALIERVEKKNDKLVADFRKVANHG